MNEVKKGLFPIYGQYMERTKGNIWNEQLRKLEGVSHQFNPALVEPCI